MQFVAASICSTLNEPPRVYLASLDAVQLPLILALLLQKLFFNQWNVNWDRPENRTAFSRRGINGNACGPLSRSTPFCSASPSSTIHVHGREEVKIKQHSYVQPSQFMASKCSAVVARARKEFIDPYHRRFVPHPVKYH